MTKMWKNEKEIFRKLDKELNGWIFEYSLNLFVPKSKEQVNNGVIIYDRPSFSFADNPNDKSLRQELGGSITIDKPLIIDYLNKKDSSARFIPFGFKIGKQSKEDLAKNPYMLARYGEEETEKLIKLISDEKLTPYLIIPNFKHRKKTYLEYNLDSTKEYFALSSINFFKDQIYIYALETGAHGYSFGIEKRIK
ncbi:MAG: hypothetical protein ACP5N2_01620 [Candidatus Nanoarchaeia archaeon]